MAGTLRVPAMKQRYELVDSHNPDERGMRFSTLQRARRELAASAPQGRFYVKDRETNECWYR